MSKVLEHDFSHDNYNLIPQVFYKMCYNDKWYTGVSEIEQLIHILTNKKTHYHTFLPKDLILYDNIVWKTIQIPEGASIFSRQQFFDIDDLEFEIYKKIT